MKCLFNPELIFWSEGFVLDNVDRSITRSDSYFKELFRQCGLHLYKSKVHHILSGQSHLVIRGAYLQDSLSLYC